MEENQNGWGGQEAPRTYGDDTKLYENGQPNYGNDQNAYSQPNYGNGQNTYNQPNYGNGQNPYGQQNYGNGQNAYGQQNYGNGQNPYGQPNYGNGQNAYGQQNYGNGQNAYGQPNYGNQPPYGYNNGNWQGNVNPQMQHGTVTDVFCNILIVVLLARVLISFFIMQQTFGAIDSYESILNGSYLLKLTGGVYPVLSMISNLLFVVMILFVVLDIVQIAKAHYKITGLILFAIFLNPGYYIWRAHILGRKKTFPIIYTVVYGGLQIAYFIYTFYMSFSLAFQMTQTMF